MDESTNKAPSPGVSQVGETSERSRQGSPVDTPPAPAPAANLAQPISAPEISTPAVQPTFAVGRELDVSELLENLSLPGDYLEILNPCILRNHLTLDQRNFRTRVTRKNHLISLITNGWDNRCLILIPDQVLVNPQVEYLLYLRELIESILQELNNRAMLFVFYESNPHVKYKQYLNETLTRPSKLVITYVACSDLRDMRDWDDEDDRDDYLSGVFLLTDLQAQPLPAKTSTKADAGSGRLAPPGPGEKRLPAEGKGILKFDEKRELAGLIQDLSFFSDGGEFERRTFLEESGGLEEAIAGIDLSKPKETVVPAIIRNCELYGELRSRPGYHALGALLEAADLTGQLPPKDGKKLYDLIIRYTLIVDEEGRAQLDEKYGSLDK